MAKQKYYVVWKGLNPGVYNTWNECEQQIKGQENALYKSFDSKEEAIKAFSDKPYQHIGKKNAKQNLTEQIITPSISVDAACSGNPGIMEYRGVDTATGKQLFIKGPFKDGTNNIGEFLALVHGLSYLKQHNYNSTPIYSDSVTAISWVRNKQAKTKLERTENNDILFELIDRAEKCLRDNIFKNQIYKWDTTNWGEIPADFGRK